MQNPHFVWIHLFQLGNCYRHKCLFYFKWELFDELAALLALWGPLCARLQSFLLTSTRLYGHLVLCEVFSLIHHHLEITNLNLLNKKFLVLLRSAMRNFHYFSLNKSIFDA